MKKNIAVLMLTGVFSFSASAQVATTKQECNRRCVTADPANPKKAQYEERLRLIREKKAAEADPERLKQLAKDEEDEIEKHRDALENMCRKICSHNPEE
jgi:hypothetical protein